MKVEKKYQSMQENSNIEVEGYNEGSILNQKEINLFEYCYALGKILQDECEFLLKNPKNNNQSDVDSIGFALLNVVLSNSKRKMDKLNDYFNINSSKELVQIKDKIVLCAKKVEEILVKYIVMPNKKTYFYRYKENMITCLIATLFKIKYINKGNCLSFIERTNNKKELSLFEKNMPLRFLFDMITGYWNSSGDKNLEEELKLNLIDNRFLCSINESTWRITLQNFLEEEYKKPMKQVQQEQKILLAFLFKKELSSIENINSVSSYECYNIIPKTVFNKKMKDNIVALCATGNLFLFPKIKNLKDNNFYELLDDKLIDFNESILLKCGYPERSEINFYHQKFSNDKYLKFLKDRENYLINEFVTLYLQ